MAAIDKSKGLPLRSAPSAKNRYSALPPNLPPTGLRREVAAAYLGISPSKFDEMVADGRMPKPKHIDGIVVWGRRSLDEAFDALPGDGNDAKGWYERE